MGSCCSNRHHQEEEKAAGDDPQNQKGSKKQGENAPTKAPSRKRSKSDFVSEASQFGALPREIKQKVSKILPAGDSVHLMQTCKSMISELQLKTASSQFFPEGRSAFDLMGAYATGDQFQCIAAIVPQQPTKLHTMTFECEWTDQQWGNRKGQLFIVAQDKPTIANPESLRSLPLQGGTVVCRSPIAEHRNTRLTMSFHPQPGTVYQIWGKAGGGGGHTLHVHGISLHRLGFGNDSTDYDAFRFEVEGSFDDRHGRRGAYPLRRQF